MGLKMTGISETTAWIAGLENALSDDVKTDIAMKAAEPIRDAMIAHAPGSIKGAIRIKSKKNGAVTVGVHRSDWKKDTFYPVYVEYGHGGPRPAPPHPYIRPAYDTSRDAAESIIKAETAKAIDSAK